jgi:xanthosine utilization system XapX-like protein
MVSTSRSRPVTAAAASPSSAAPATTAAALLGLLLLLLMHRLIRSAKPVIQRRRGVAVLCLTLQ